MEIARGNEQKPRMNSKLELSNEAKKSFTVEKQTATLIRPAKETYNGLYFLSNLDQNHRYTTECVFAYNNYKENEEEKAMQVLKESLGRALVEFYPFAGCLTTSWDGKMMVRCTGEGVPFVEAVSDNNIEDIGDVTLPDIRLRKLIHTNEEADSILDVPLLSVQVTKFKCGGIALGMATTHVLADGKAFSDFLICWAEIARGMPLSTPPILDRSIFSPRNPILADIPHPEFIQDERRKKTIKHQNKESVVYRSFCFEPEKLAQLKKMANDNDEINKTPTSFEVISALVWTNWTKALKLKPNETTRLLTSVDGRPRFKTTSIPKGYFGNGIVLTCAQCKAGDLMQKPFSFAVKIVHEAIMKVNEDYVRSAIDYYEVKRGGFETENTCNISTWSALGFYDIDFGFGKPTQVGPASLMETLAVVLSQGKDSKNKIVALSLPESAMEIFEDLMLLELKRK